MPKLKEFLFGGKDKTKQLSTMDASQKQLMDLIYQGLKTGEGPFGELFGNFDEAAFNEGVKKPALKSFAEDILPQLNEKFIAGNQVAGSGMQRAQAKAATDLQSKLAELMYGAQNQQKQNKLQGLGLATGKQTVENIYKQGSEGLIPGMAKGFAQGAGQAAGGAIAG